MVRTQDYTYGFLEFLSRQDYATVHVARWFSVIINISQGRPILCSKRSLRFGVISNDQIDLCACQ